MKTKNFIIILLALCSTIVYGQDGNQSEIIISKDHLISLIRSIKDKKAEIFKQQNEINQSKDSITTKTIQPFLQQPITTNNNQQTKQPKQSQQDLDKKLAQLENEIKLLNAKIDLLLKDYKTDVIPINKTIPIENTSKTTLLAVEKVTDTTKSNAEKEKINQSLDTLQSKYNALLQVFTERTPIIDTIYINNITENNYLTKLEEYSNQKKQLFFENNSKMLNKDTKITLDKIIMLLSLETKVDISLNGYASNIGNHKYNENLSFLRTETVKRYLISKGINPLRILSQYHGIDFTALNEADARRVDITFIVRK